MTHKKDQDVITALVKVLTQHQNGNSAIPDIYRGNNPLPVPERPGFLARLFDRAGAMQDANALKQLEVILDTGLAALQTEAKGYLDTVKLDVDSKVRVHKHRVLQQEAVLKKEAEGQAVIDLHVMQRRLSEQMAALGFDTGETTYIIGRIIATCMGKSNDKENHHGNK